MLLAACVLLCADSTSSYSGRDHQLDVPIPRLEAEVVIDGDLADSVWGRAARLTGFSQYSPNDDVPAADSTHVLVWYSATAIYFGIRAFEQHGRPTVTLASRDQIFDDDNVQILLGTFRDAKQVLMFAVNPLGVQGDGSLVEGANVTAGGFIGSAVVGREQPDLSPDFVFQSRGRVTDWGYEVEVRIPFKSIRYQPRQPQDWRLNIVRQIKHSGFEDSWYPARRASATFIGQSGNLVGLTGMHRGLVMDLNPEATGKASGAPTPSGYRYDLGNPQVGGNIRWGVSDNLTLNGTIKPDFSQVETDAGQLAFDPRQALFFP
ncbi:MAG TPA: carbohydrate binding family 9 domain-containing protein, partial [Gemmatimonadales bacterium]|nr:carbohydrate binding family 9 domain-containing protein [Gemmatimonadales bacterium]